MRIISIKFSSKKGVSETRIHGGSHNKVSCAFDIMPIEELKAIRKYLNLVIRRKRKDK